MTRCKLCHKKMSRNMLRHLRLKHPKVARQVQVRPSTKSTSRKNNMGGTWVKRYCTKIGDKKYQCNICENVLRMPNGLFGNMKRHIKSKHPFVYHEEVKPQLSEDEARDTEEYLEESDDEKISDLKSRMSVEETLESESEIETENTENVTTGMLSETDPEFEQRVKFLCLKPVLGRKRAKSYVWNFFDVVEENHIYICLACNRKVFIFPHSIANLKRHIRLRHRKQHELMLKYKPQAENEATSISFDKYYFESLEEENRYKCKVCEETVICQVEDHELLFEHIKDKHPDQILSYTEEEIEVQEEVEGDEDKYNVVIINNEVVQEIINSEVVQEIINNEVVQDIPM